VNPSFLRHAALKCGVPRRSQKGVPKALWGELPLAGVEDGCGDFCEGVVYFFY